LLLKRTEENEIHKGAHKGAENDFVENRFFDSSCNEEQTTSGKEMVDSNFYQTISRFLR